MYVGEIARITKSGVSKKDIAAVGEGLVAEVRHIDGSGRRVLGCDGRNRLILKRGGKTLRGPGA